MGGTASLTTGTVLSSTKENDRLQSDDRDRGLYMRLSSSTHCRAWHTKAKVRARLIGDEGPDEWDLPHKPE